MPSRRRHYKEVEGRKLLRCSKCLEFKDLENDFYHSKPELPDGCQTYCKSCFSNYGKIRNTKEKNRENTLRKHGIGSEYYDQLYKKQEGKCAICGNFQERLHVDHDHITKIIRGLLCNPCNNALGLFKDDIVLLQGAISYLIGV